MRIPLVVCLAIALTVVVHPGRAQPVPDIEDLAGRELVVTDLAPRRLLPMPSRRSTGATLGASLAMRQRPERREIAGGILITVPTSMFGSSRKAKRVTEPKLPAADDIDDEPAAAGEPAHLGERHAPAPVLAGLPLIRPGDARAAVAAARRHRGAPAADGRLDEMAARARWSAVLPRVRLRATRLIDESSSLSPTSYDPNRVTSSGGASLWLEARTTWSLDRLLFATEEVSIARLRQALADDDRALQRRVLELLFGWQRAVYRARDPLAQPDRCIESWLDEQQLGAALDVQTAGWFSRWLRSRRPPPPPCMVIAADESSAAH